jgi:hypothetical protein
MVSISVYYLSKTQLNLQGDSYEAIYTPFQHFLAYGHNAMEEYQTHSTALKHQSIHFSLDESAK